MEFCAEKGEHCGQAVIMGVRYGKKNIRFIQI